MRHVRWIAPVLALAMFGWIMGSVAKAQAPATGTIQGKVVDKDGKAVAGAKVIVVVAPAKGDHAKGDRAKGEHKRPAPVAEATTDDKGEFTASVPAGEYIVLARKPGIGGGHEKVTVTASQTASVTLTLEKRKGGHHGGAGGGVQ